MFGIWLVMSEALSLTALSICSRSSENRTIPLNAIAERTRLSVEDVEYLLMKSLSVSRPLQKPCLALSHRSLMTLLFSSGSSYRRHNWSSWWNRSCFMGSTEGVRHRQVKSLRDRLDTWVGKVHTTLLSVEAETPDLISSWCSSLSAERVDVAFPDVKTLFICS